MPDYVVPITNLKYWSTNVCTTQYFNEFIRFSLKRDIKERIISSAESGSAWRFRQFNYIKLKVLSSKFELQL